MKYYHQLTRHVPGIEWRPADDIVRNVRRIKSAREFDCYREAGEIVSRALNLLIEGLIAGKPEAEAAGDAAREVARGGGAIHMIPVSHGELIEYFVRKPLPGYSEDAPKDGDLVRGWVYGPIREGYYMDPGRTAVAGRKPSAAQKEVVETCAGVVETVMAAIKPGVLVMDVAEIGDKAMAAAGGEKDQAAEKFPLYGHGLGLFFEKPYISKSMGNADDVFEAGMVMGVEAFLGRKGVGSAGCEQNLIVTTDGIGVLDSTPMLWW